MPSRSHIVVITLLTLGLHLSLVAPAQATLTPIPATAVVTKSYADWKNEKLHSAEQRLKEARDRLVIARQQVKNPADPRITEALRQVTQAEWDADVVNGLSITDYLVLYLSAGSNSAKMKEAAAKFTPEETYRLLEAYLKSLKDQREELNKSNISRHSAIDED